MFSSDKWFGASAGFYPETIDQSLRFEDGDSPYLRRTPSSSGNRRTWTLSFWYKRGNLTSSTQWLLGTTADSSANELNIVIQNDALTVGNNSTNILKSDNLLRDVSNFYHILIEFDSTQASASDRMKFYINGTETSYQTDNRSSQVSQNAQLGLNNTVIHSFGARSNNSGYSDGYFAEVNLIDGTSLTPSSFGETKNGVWIPKEISGLTYGTNGFRFTFADSSSLGDDTSGNGNDFTSSGLASTDVCTDSPTNNFCTLNHLQQRSNSSATFSEGNLKAVGASASASGIFTGTFGVSSGKWYWEVRATGSAQYLNTGIVRTPFDPTSTGDSGILSNEYVYINNGNKYNNNSSASYGASYTSGDIIGVALDLDADTLTFYKNGSSQGVAYSSLPSGTYLPIFDCYNSSSWILNAGQEGTFVANETAQGNTDANGIGDFYYTPPSGFLALCSANLPDTTLSPNQSTQADDHFNTVLWTGNASNTHQITGVGFQPDWVWIKERTNASSHYLIDSSRGLGTGDSFRALLSDNTDAEYTALNDQLRTLDSDGFTLDDNTDTNFYVNRNSQTYVAWNWKANGGTTSSNTDGTITSTVQANTTAGFSIVLYTGTGSNGTIGHGLGKVPKWILIKERNGTRNWIVYHAKNTSAPETEYLHINKTLATQDSAVFWNDTAPTSSVISLGTGGAVNFSGNNYVAFVFAEIEGYSKFGSYQPNGSTDGTYIHLGFSPSFFMAKSITASGYEWVIIDNKRTPFNEIKGYLVANEPSSESTSYNFVDFLSNGIKIRASSGNDVNASGHTVIYMAFADQPFKFSNAK